MIIRHKYIGIDPGKSGAVAFIHKDKVKKNIIEAYDCPDSIVDMGKLVRKKMIGYEGYAIIEKVHSMPKQGVVSSFTFGTNFGAWQGILAVLGIPLYMVTPNKWQKAVFDSGGGKNTKDKSLDLARRLYPNIDLHLKKDHNKADALLMIKYLRQILRKERLSK